MVFEQLRSQWLSLVNVIEVLSEDDYRMSHPLLHASIGQHTRHVIEILQCLVAGLDSGVVDYVHRTRNLEIEVNKDLALQLLRTLTSCLPNADKPLKLLVSSPNEEPLLVSTTYYRELVYNMEHAVHHLAIMRIGLESMGICLPASFGVAESTLLYRSTLVG